MSAVEIRPARVSDLKAIAAAMRPIDVLECAAMGHGPRDALRLGFRASDLIWTADLDGRPAAMFGCVADCAIQRRAKPWFLATVEAPKAARAFLELAPSYVRIMAARYPTLRNHVHARNRASHGWLRRLGFEIALRVDHFGGEPFHPFWLAPE